MQQRGCLSRLGDLFAGLATLYALIVLVMLATGLLLPRYVDVGGVIAGAAAIFLLPSALLLLLPLLFRRWRVGLLLVPLVVAFVVIYSPYFVPRTLASVEGEMFTVLTFNLAAPEADEVGPLLDVIRSADADIVALQELSADAADAVKDGLSDLYPHRSLHPQDNPHDGQGVLSRFAINETRFFEFEGQARTQGHMRAELALESGPIAVYNIHPVPPLSFSRGLSAGQHAHAVDSLLAIVQDEALPTLVIGDFNMNDQFNEYARFTSGYTDAYRAVGEVGFGFTYPAGGPLPVPPVLRLDYVFYDARFAAQSARVWPEVGTSDHHPVWARLALQLE